MHDGYDSIIPVGRGRPPKRLSGTYHMSLPDPTDSHAEPSRGRLTLRRRREAQHGLARWMPGLHTLLRYEGSWLRHDVVAGLALSVMLVPTGIAYAVAAGLPGLNGLYATLAGLLAYALFGPSRRLVYGPDSALAALILAVVLPLSAGDPARAVALAGAMALVSGVVCLVGGLARLGFIVQLLSTPIRHGYMNGIAFTVLVSQLPALFGFGVEGGQVLQKLRGFVLGLFDGQADVTAVALGLATLLIVVVLRNSRTIPGVLVAIVLATLVTAQLGLEAKGVEILGRLPQGLPSPALPWITLADLATVLMGGVSVALLAFAETSVLSRSYAHKHREEVDPNQEMIALGMVNIASGLFQGFPLSSSALRTPVAEAAGSRSQLTGIVGAIAVAVLLLAGPDLLQHLPMAALAAIIIAAASRLFEFAELRRIYRMQRWEFWLSVGCSAGVIVLGAIPGIGLAVVLAIIEFLWDGWKPHSAILGRVDGLKGYHDLKRYPHARQIPGLVLFRWDAPLFFANAEPFSLQVRDAIAAAPEPVRWLVITAEPVTSVDVTAADMLTELHAELREAGIELHFAEMKDPVKDKLRQFGIFEHFGTDGFFPTIGEAVNGYLESHDVGWLDWEEPEQIPLPGKHTAS